MVQAGINTAIGLVGYLLIVAVIGYWGSTRVDSEEDFFLGGEQLPGWALALSERSSAMSGWLLLGMPGLAWSAGLSSVWVLVGTATGAIIQWLFYSQPFMEGRKETGAVTPIGLIAEKFPGDTPVLRLLPALITFVFYMGYVGSQFLAGGKILQIVFGIDPIIGLVTIAGLIILYSLAGGFLAVVWTDALQALLMVFTLVLLPIVLFSQVLADPSFSLMGRLAASGSNRASWFGGKSGAAVLILLGANLSWFFTYLGGYPHLAARMMALRDEADRRSGVIIASFWTVLASAGAILIGLLARAIYGAPQAVQADREMVLPFMILNNTPALLGGILLAGALAAMMSTADSQLVVASSAAAEDVYNKVVTRNRKFSEAVRLRISRVATLVVGVIGLVIALTVEDLVYLLISYAGTGLFSSFGPAFTLLFFWKERISKAGVICAFIVGPAVTIAWISLGLTSIITVRLIAPPLGFAAAIIGSLLWPPESPVSRQVSAPTPQD